MNSFSGFAVSRTEDENRPNTPIERRQDKQLICGELKNPLDALQILSQVAAIDSKQPEEELFIHQATGSTLPSPDQTTPPNRLRHFAQRDEQVQDSIAGVKAYRLVEIGALEFDTIIQLVQQ